MEAEVKLGTKETEEAIVAIFAIAELLIERFKDGAGVDDVVAIYDALSEDVVFQAKIVAAYENYKQIPAEVKDLDIEGGFKLAGVILPLALNLIKSFKK